METNIKIDLDELIHSKKPVIIELGCGQTKKEGRIGVDIIDMPHVDIITDIEQGLPFLPDNSVDEFHCSSLLEHIMNFEGLLKEIVRVLKDSGAAYIFVPHFSNPHFYSDYTHKRFFGLYTFYYFADEKYQMRRKVPSFYSDIRIKILSQHLVFRTLMKLPCTPYKIQRPVKYLCELAFNLSQAIQEYYEENLCYMFPCKGIEIVFTVNKKNR